MPKCLVKWAGGKAQLSSHILAAMPHGRLGTYYEPFVGGGAIFFRLAETKRFRKFVIGDANEELIEFYRNVRDKRAEMEVALLQFEEAYQNNPEEFYYELRGADPATLSRIDRSARFLFLNKACFNGIYRVNKAGKFNVPWGKKAIVKSFDPQNLIDCSTALQESSILCEDFESVASSAEEDSVVYLDPPYLPKVATSFTAYTSAGFGLADHERLAKLALMLHERGVFVMVSNSNMPEILALYDEKNFIVEEIGERRGINCKSTGRGKIQELFIRSRRGK